MEEEPNKPRVGSIFGSLVQQPRPPPELPDEDAPNAQPRRRRSSFPKPRGLAALAAAAGDARNFRDEYVRDLGRLASLLGRVEQRSAVKIQHSWRHRSGAPPASAATPSPSLLSRLTSSLAPAALASDTKPSMMRRMLATERAHADYRKKKSGATATAGASSVAEAAAPTKPTLKPSFSMKGTRLTAPVEPAQSPTEPRQAEHEAEKPDGNAAPQAQPQAHTVTRLTFGSGGKADGGVGKAGLATTKQDQVQLNSGSRVRLETPKTPRFECKMPNMKMARSCPGLFFGSGADEQA